MISIEERTKFAKAEQKAREIKPRVTVKDYAAGEYTVESGQPGKDPYTVKFSKDVGGHWVASCNCTAHRGPEHLTEVQRLHWVPKACYHIPAAYSSHRIQVNIRKQVRAALEVAPAIEAERFCTCGELATSKEGYCDFCQVEFVRTMVIAQTEKDYADLLEPIYRADAEYKAARAEYRNPGDRLPGAQYDLPAPGRCPHCKRPFMSDEYDCYFMDCPGKAPVLPVAYTPEMEARDTADLFG